MAFENRIHFTYDGRAAGFDAIVVKHGGDIVGENTVWVEDGLVFVHSGKVDAFRDDYGHFAFLTRCGVPSVVMCESAGSQAGNGLNDCAMAGIFDQRKEKQFSGRDIVFKLDCAPLGCLVIESELCHVRASFLYP